MSHNISAKFQSLKRAGRCRTSPSKPIGSSLAIFVRWRACKLSNHHLKFKHGKLRKAGASHSKHAPVTSVAKIVFTWTRPSVQVFSYFYFFLHI